MEAVLSAGFVIAGIVILLLATSIKIVQEYERGVVFRLGRCVGAKGPGVFFIIPLLDKITKINLQIIAAPVASQAVITRDNVTVTVDAVAYFQVIDPAASVVRCDWYTASQLEAKSRFGRDEARRGASIERILYLEGVPNMQRLVSVKIGETVPEQLGAELETEKEAIARSGGGHRAVPPLPTREPGCSSRRSSTTRRSTPTGCETQLSLISRPRRGPRT